MSCKLESVGRTFVSTYDASQCSNKWVVAVLRKLLLEEAVLELVGIVIVGPGV